MTILPVPKRLQQFTRAAVCASALALLAGCAEREPTSTLDGIFTAEQASRGEGLFNTHCVRCHSIQEFSGPAYQTIWVGVPLSALYLRIANTMPLDQPGSLGTTEATAITAHILQANNMPPGNEQLGGDVEWLTGIAIAQN
jgi:mono/diheme cytochrome c family protein